MLKPGMFISDRYEIIDKVGSGGMADVYKAKCHRLNRFVAIKVLKPEYSSDKSFVNKFRGEAQSAAGLSHPNIVNVYDVGDDAGLHYIVMELVEGITLKRFIERKGKLEVKEAVGIAIQIAQGMEAAHANHIIHRDIKPQNIIISKDGKVKVTDFGIAKATTSNTITSNAMGSVHYLSPEQARGGYSDEKSDIYSLGVTLYEMLSGKVPFAGDNTVSVALLHIQGEAMPLRDLDPQIPISVDKIVQKCMQKRPERRYHSASELIQDLKRALANPDGDFVKIPAFVANDSPTINISDDLGKIKNGTLREDTYMESRKEKVSKTTSDEDEDLDTVDSKVEKVFVVGSIIAVVILGTIIICLVAWFFVNNGKKNDKKSPETKITSELSPTGSLSPIPTGAITTEAGSFIVPDVTEYTAPDAEKLIKSKAPDITITYKEDYSDEIEKDLVMKQYPEGNKEYPADGEIILTISLGPQKFELPGVVGLNEDQVKEKYIDELGLKVEFSHEFNDTIQKGLVISTDPEAPAMVLKGDTIKVVLSDGKEQSDPTVPTLTGMKEKDAIKALTDLGFKKGSVTYQPSDTYARGIVTYQSNTAGQTAPIGTAIDMIVSSGSATEPDQPSGNVNYYGSLKIDINPFDTIGKTEGVVFLDLEQNGEHTEIYNKFTTTDDLPIVLSKIEGTSDADGIVTMYVDDEPFVLDGELKTWVVHFEAVEE